MFYKIASFSLFKSERVILEEIEIIDKSYLIRIDYVPSDATIQSSIQIMKVENGDEVVLSFYERYNYLKSYEVKSDSFFIVIDDTLRKHVKEVTHKIKLPLN